MADGSGRSRGLLTAIVLAAIIIAGAALLAVILSGRRTSALAVKPAENMDENFANLREVDPALVKYRKAGEITLDMADPRGIALASDQGLWVAGGQAVRIHTAQGAQTGAFPLPGTGTCVTLDSSGDALFIGLKDHVAVYNTAGKQKARWPSLGPSAYITCIAVTRQDVWVADAGNKVVIRHDLKGRELGRVGQRDVARGVLGIICPSPHLDVVPLPDGNVLVNNPGRHKVETYAPDGALKESWGKYSATIEGFCGCCNPTDIALLPDGKIVTSEKGLPRVKVYTRDGQLESVVATPNDFTVTSAGLDLAVGLDGKVYVLDPQAKSVKVFQRIAVGEAPRPRP